jgi:hypothetical protein
MLPQHANNLLFRKSGSLHLSVLHKAGFYSAWRKFAVAGHVSYGLLGQNGALRKNAYVPLGCTLSSNDDFGPKKIY